MINLKQRVYHLIAEHDEGLACLYNTKYKPTPYIVSDINIKRSIESQSQFWLDIFQHLKDITINEKSVVYNVLTSAYMKFDVDAWLTAFEVNVLPIILKYWNSGK